MPSTAHALSTCSTAKSVHKHTDRDYPIMNYKFYLWLCGLLLAGTCVQAQSADSLSLQQCIDIALRNNLQVKQTGLTAEQDRIYYNQAKESLLPSINGNVTHAINNGRSQDPTTYSYVNEQVTLATYSLSGSLTLFNGLALINSIKQTRLAYEAGKMDFQQAKDVVTINLITAYLQVLSNTEQLAQAQAQAEVSRQNVQRQKVLNDAGSGKPSDLYDLQGKLATDQLTVINAQNALESSRLALLQIMNVPYQQSLRLERVQASTVFVRFPLTADQVYNEALNDLALVKSAQLKRQSAEKGVKAAKGQLYPNLSLNGGVFTNYSNVQQSATPVDSMQASTGAFTRQTADGPVTGKVYAYQKVYDVHDISYGTQLKNNYNSSINISLQLPILNFFQKRNNVALAKIALLNAQYVEESTRIQLRQSVDLAYVNMTTAYNSYQVLQDQVKAFEESYRSAKIRYDAGVLNSIEFVTVKNNLDQANINLISAKYNYAIRMKILDYYQGKL